jgi:FkbM family methyltransferase
MNPKRWAKAALRRFGYDIVQSEPRLIDFLRSRNVDLMLDVGANTGQFGLSLRAAGFQGEILSFEPVNSVFSRLENTAHGDERWRVHKLALGAASGRATINVSENTVFSSILPQTAAAQEHHSAAMVQRREEIDVATLDEIFEPFRHRRAFLKIDTQGFERHVLDGGTESLRLIQGVQLELPIVHLYESTWSLAEAVEYMRERNFVVSQIRPTGFPTVDPVSLVEVDCVFRRSDV